MKRAVTDQAIKKFFKRHEFYYNLALDIWVNSMPAVELEKYLAKENRLNRVELKRIKWQFMFKELCSSRPHLIKKFEEESEGGPSMIE